ncbi:MarR family winged helix-turn-helix transcriptional regulator [Kineococcus arenarius]|uniref:MarR family winged helix-turn-helix transcriptional regulator n=1 Tax=unclassified Kineococcus TaxID=2621656 RepID=UPI003D7E151B
MDEATAVQLWADVIAGFETTNNQLHALLKRDFDVSPADVDTLVRLSALPERRAPMAALAAAAAFTTGGYTKVADRLTARALTVRVPSEVDRRVTYLQLTAAGEDLATRLRRCIAEYNTRHVIDVLGAQRAQELARAMAELHAANRHPHS